MFLSVNSYINTFVFCTISTLLLSCNATSNVTQTIIIFNRNSSSINSTVQENESKPPLFKLMHKGYLIVNNGTGLRSRESYRIHSLLYVEYDNHGQVINRFPMRNLADVANLFHGMPNIEVCYDHCEWEVPVGRSGPQNSTDSVVQPSSAATIGGGNRKEISSSV